MRAFSEGAAPELRAHLALCRTCEKEWGQLGELRSLSKQLPAQVPDTGQRDALRNEVLARLELQRPTLRRAPARWRWVGGAVAAAACLALVLRLWAPARTPSGPAVTSFRATVQTHGAAVRFTHERSGGDERVLLGNGQLLIEVAPLQPGERFRVLCGDAEVEVRGTSFEVDAAGDHLLGVRVLHGRVEVRPSGERSLLLGPGERWLAGPLAAPAAEAVSPGPAASAGVAAVPHVPSAPPAASSTPLEGHGPPRRSLLRKEGTAGVRAPQPEPPAPAAPHAPAAASVSATATSPAPRRATPEHERQAPRSALPSAAERAFDEGWATLQRGDFSTAAEAFGRIESLAGSEPIIEDARFWRAVALGRSGQGRAEADALVRFLLRHPGSSRAGEASAILGWLLVKQGRLDEAEQRFQAAALDKREEIRRSARAGLAAITARRAPAPR